MGIKSRPRVRQQIELIPDYHNVDMLWSNQLRPPTINRIRYIQQIDEEHHMNPFRVVFGAQILSYKLVMVKATFQLVDLFIRLQEVASQAQFVNQIFLGCLFELTSRYKALSVFILAMKFCATSATSYRAHRLSWILTRLQLVFIYHFLFFGFNFFVGYSFNYPSVSQPF